MSAAAERLSYRVLLRSPSFDPSAVCAVLGARTALPPETLLPVVRRGWGLLPEPSSEEGAKSLAAELSAAGQLAVAVPASLVEEPPRPAAVTRAELSGDGLDVLQGRAGAERRRFGWTKLAVLAAGAVVEKTAKSVSVSVRARKTRRVEDEKRTPFIELLFAEPAARLRIVAAEFDYSALGDRMSYSAELNFRALVEELGRRAPGALRSKGARAILAKAPSGESSYESFEDCGAELRWLLTLSALKAAA